MVRLGVNIDHVATLRQARGGREPDPVGAAVLAELGGADGITVHLREDRRHIQDRDLRVLKETVRTRLNLEAALTEEILSIALEVRPEQVTFVPERRAELTTEGGLDLVGCKARARAATERLRGEGIEVSFFLDPEPRQIEAAVALGATAVELHTGRYAESGGRSEQERTFLELAEAAALVRGGGMHLHAGHGLNYENVGPIAMIPGMEELNIGHSIVSRAVLTGMEGAVREMKRLIEAAVMQGRLRSLG